MFAELLQSINGFVKLKSVLFWMLLIFCVACIVPLHTVLVFSHSEVILSTSARVPPTIDGVISTPEWADANVSGFIIGTTIKALLYVMNDNLNLYLAVHITDDDFGTNSSTRDVVEFYFDNDHDGFGPEPGDDKLACTSWSFDSFDLFWRELSGWTWDELYVGANDGIVAATGNGTYSYFELSHPLDSADNDHDFSLAPGDSVGFMLGYIDKNIHAGYWPAGAHPNSAPSDWHDIVISEPCTDANVEELISADEFSPNATKIDFDNLTIGTHVSNQYSSFGVRFLDDNWTTPQINGPVERGCTATSSNPNSLFNLADTLDSNNSGIPLTITFTAPQAKVGFYMGGPEGNETIIANLTAYDNRGEPIGSVEDTVPETVEEFFGIHSLCEGIFAVTLDYGDSILGEEIDDLIFAPFESAPSIIDSDEDGVPDAEDNSPSIYNPWQLDSDGDGVGDASDNCEFTYNPDQIDSDGDGVGDACEISEDLTPPIINLTHTPQQPQANRIVNFTVWAVDPSGIEWITLWINGVNVKNSSESPCTYTGGPYGNRTYVYYAMAYDMAGNLGISEYRSFTIDPIDYEVLGDANDDEEMSAVDALIALQMAEGVLSQSLAADVDFDMDVTVLDALKTLGEVVDLPNLLVSRLEIGEVSVQEDVVEIPVEFWVSNDGAGIAGIFNVEIRCFAIENGWPGTRLSSTFRELDDPSSIPSSKRELEPPSWFLLPTETFEGWVEIPVSELTNLAATEISLQVHVDPDDEVRESAEWDNIRETEFPVQTPVIIEDVTPGSTWPGRWVTIIGEGFGEAMRPERGVGLQRAHIRGGEGEFEPIEIVDMPIDTWTNTEILARVPYEVGHSAEVEYVIGILDHGSFISNLVPLTVAFDDLDWDGLDDSYEDELMLRYAPYYLFDVGEVFWPSTWETIASHSEFKKKEWTWGADCLDDDEHRAGSLWDLPAEYDYFNNKGPNNIYINIHDSYRHGEGPSTTEYAHITIWEDNHGIEWIVIEYWKCYAYSSAVSIEVGGLEVVGLSSHEGDWERVVVFLDLRGNFVKMLYAHHGESVLTYSPQWYDGTHPKVYVQDGSHGSWPSSGYHGGGFHKGDGVKVLANPINVGEAHYPRNGCGSMLRFNGWWGDADCESYQDHGPTGPIPKGGDSGWHWPPNQPNPWS